jgi:anti-anti-sigma factor
VAISEELAGDFESLDGVAGDVQVFFDADGTLILLSGEIDLALGPELEDAGHDAVDRGQQIRIDVARVTFIDSVGLGFIARMASAGHESGCPPILLGGSRRVREGIALVGLDVLLA